MTDVDLTDKTVLIGTPLPTKNLVPGSQVMTAACGHDVHVAPSGREILDEAGEDGVLMCMACVMTHPAFVEKMKEQNAPLAFTGKQAAEVSEALGTDARRIFATLGIKEKEVTE